MVDDPNEGACALAHGSRLLGKSERQLTLPIGSLCYYPEEFSEAETSVVYFDTHKCANN